MEWFVSELQLFGNKTWFNYDEDFNEFCSEKLVDFKGLQYKN